MATFLPKHLCMLCIFPFTCLSQSQINITDLSAKPIGLAKIAPISLDSNQTSNLITTPLSKDFENKKAIIGSMYLEDSFKEAKLDNENKTYELRYNNLNDNFEFLQNEKDLIAISKENYPIVKFLDGREFLLKKIKIGNKTKNTYLERISSTKNDSKVNIYKQDEVIFISPKSSNGYTETVNAEFKKEPTKYFLELENNDPILFKKTEDLKKVFPTKKTEIISFIKENKTNMESELY